MADEPVFPQSERRQGGPLVERVTRLEERFDAFARIMERQITVDAQVHASLQRLLEKYDERADKEHDAVLLLSTELRSFVKTAALIGGAIVVIANIIAPIAVKLWVP